MPQSFKVIFKKDTQRQFLEHVEKKISVANMARLCACSERTIRDWRREKFPMDEACFVKLCKRIRMTPPKEISLLSRYAHTSEAGKKGAMAMLQKFGGFPADEAYRKAQWKKWWDTNGKFHLPSHLLPIPLHKPRKSADLAEFVGIVMGDGSISDYQVSITLHQADDLSYSRYIAKLIKKLFHLTPKVYHRPKYSVLVIVVSRRELVSLLHSFGLPIGNKIRQRLAIPNWIKDKEAYTIACVRGLLDTDGTVINHQYTVNGKMYCYKKLAFTSASQQLRDDVARIFANVGIKSRIAGRDVRIDSVENVRRYFEKIGSNNPKHLKRYKNSSTISSLRRVAPNGKAAAC